eukprot:GFUD01112150.1.p1 GENE.GFUD01112150.1~~GFUD01112150.1.p1  ORF type:complete len:184 (-),score=57.85 GFUD01112150.1:128-679(-)
MSEKEVKKICSCMSLNLVKWKLASKEGKIILDYICCKLYSKEKDEENNKSIDDHFDEELHVKCQTLANILNKMSEAVAEIELGEDKAVGLEQLCDLSVSMNKSILSNKSFNSSSSNNHNSSIIELDKSVLLSSDLTKWTQTILKCYKNQLKMNQIVSQNICHLRSRGSSVPHQHMVCAARAGY